MIRHFPVPEQAANYSETVRVTLQRVRMSLGTWEFADRKNCGGLGCGAFHGSRRSSIAMNLGSWRSDSNRGSMGKDAIQTERSATLFSNQLSACSISFNPVYTKAI